MMSKKQKTIQKEVSLIGVGLHTGNDVKMTFKPAPENHGFAFKRVDLEGCPTIEARAEFVFSLIQVSRPLVSTNPLATCADAWPMQVTRPRKSTSLPSPTATPIIYLASWTGINRPIQMHTT